MAALVARTGRELQRYENGCRLVVGCIPYREKMGILEVLVITSQKGHGMMFPKGGWESDEEMVDAAKREAMEEAGVTGEIQEGLGTWNFCSKTQIDNVKIAFLFPLLVSKELEEWPEQGTRRRRWVSIVEARQNCQYSWMKEGLKKLERRLLSIKNMKATL